MVSLAELEGYPLGSSVIEYEERDVLLYNLAVGARGDEMSLVYERDLVVLPTYALALGLGAVEAAGRLGAYDRAHSLHVGQELSMRRRLPRESRFEMASQVRGVYDKGSAALVEVAVDCEYFEASYVLFIPGAGGFGGSRGPSIGHAEPIGEPEVTFTTSTEPRQALWYRLTGDRHALHVDPTAAATAGFDRPILHGLCTLGAVVLDASRATGRDPSTVSGLSARFQSPVLPGDLIAVEGWSQGNSLDYRACVGDRAVLSGETTWA